MPQPRNDPERSKILDQVDRIEQSPGFRRSRQLRGLLRYIVERSLERKHLVLKEYTLGVDVFGRATDFDPRLDGIVRVQAHKLRSRLESYYEGEGRTDEVRIEVPEGSYVPRIVFAPDTQSAWGGAASQATIAVLPFEGVDLPAGQDYLPAGISGAIIASLSSSQSLRVVARASSSAFGVRPVDYRKAAETLGASHILDGSVRHSGARIEVRVRLIDNGANDAGDEAFELEADKVSKIHTEIADSVIERLHVPVSEDELGRIREPGTADAQSYHAYLEGWHSFNQWTEDGLFRARGCFERAVRIDPKNGAAHAGLAWAWFGLANNGAVDSNEAAAKARLAADAAVSIAPALSESQTAVGAIRAAFEHRWEEAEAAYREAIRLAPSSSFARHSFAQLVLIPQRRFEEAVNEMQRARELDPLSVITVAENCGRALCISKV